MYKEPLHAEILDFDEYFKSVDKDVRTSYNKAQRNGCKVIKIDKITDALYQDILDIYASKDQRQGRDINYLYHKPEGGSWDLREGWPHVDYNEYTCDRHYMDFYGCFIGDKMVAFLELLHSNEFVSTYATMGHADYLKKGIMKFLFIEAIRLGKFKYLQYGDKSSVEQLKVFLSDLRINKYDPNFIYSISEA